jgi:hypothetical protein
MADAEFRKERFQGQILERDEDGFLHERYLKVSPLLLWLARCMQQEPFFR